MRPTRRARKAASLASLALLLGASPAAAEERLGLVDAPPTLREAVGIVLEPWNVHVVDIGPPAPAATMPEAAKEARAISLGSTVDALAWLSESAGGRSLWLYDARNDQLVSRQISADPTDEASAAAVALTLKTLMRSSTVAPPAEQLGAAAARPVDARATSIRLELDGGLRLGATNSAPVGPRVGLGVAWWPRFLAGRAGVMLRLEEGLGFAIRTEEFRGRLGDHDAGLLARGSIPFATRFAFQPGLGATLHFTTLDGAPIDGDGPTSVTRVDPSIDASLGVAAALGGDFEVGLRLTGSAWTRWQRYGLDFGRAVEVSPLQGGISLFVGAGIR